MVGSAAALIGIGGAPLMSIYLGEGKREKAFAVVANCFLMLCILSVALTAVLFPMKEPMLLFSAQAKQRFRMQTAIFLFISQAQYSPCFPRG